MHERVAVGDHLDAPGEERVDELADRLLVAGNGAGGEDDGVAGRKLRRRVLVLGHAGERRARLALASGRERENPLTRQALEGVHAEELRHAIEHAAFACDRDDPLHRAPQNADLPARSESRLGCSAQPRDIGGESGDDHPALRPADEVFQHGGDVALGRAFALAQDVGRVADEGEDALVAERPEARFVRRDADDRGRVDLPVAGMDGEARRRANRECRALRDRMSDGDEFDVERPDRHALAGPHDLDRNFGCAGLPEAARLRESGSEGRSIDLHAEARPQIGERADMVFVRMGDDDAGEVLSRLLDETDVGHDEIDAGQVVACEGDAEIDHQPLARLRRPIAVERAIHADFAQAPQGREHELAVVCHSGRAFPRGRSGRSRHGRAIRLRDYPEIRSFDCFDPTLPAKQQTAVSVKPHERPLASPASILDPDSVADPRRMVEPGGTDCVESFAGAPSAERFVETEDKTLEERARFDDDGASENRRWIALSRRRALKIDADADDAGQSPRRKRKTFDQQPRAFRAVVDKIVRPFEPSAGGANIRGGAGERDACDESKLGRFRLRTWIDQQSAGVEIAARRDPGSPAPTAAGVLLAGGDPEAARVARERAAARLLVGGVDRVEPSEPPAGRRGLLRAQNSVCAAAIAASVSSQGAKTNTMISSAAIACTARATNPWRSNALAGSSKYINLTIRR